MKPITRWIKPGTTIYSDRWSSYKDIGKSGWHHLFVNHSLEFIDPETGCHTYTILSCRLIKVPTLPTRNRRLI